MTQITGFSKEAQFVDGMDKENWERWNHSATFTKQPAYDELGEVWDDCRTRNWDCHGASPVEQDALRNAYLFIESLPLGCPLPRIGAEPDGHVTVEWYRDPRWILSVSISPDDTICYAALFGLSDAHGSEPFFGEVSSRILNLIRRVVEI